MPLNIISYKKAIWKGIEGHLKGIVQKLEDSLIFKYIPLDGAVQSDIWYELWWETYRVETYKV